MVLMKQAWFRYSHQSTLPPMAFMSTWNDQMKDSEVCRNCMVGAAAAKKQAMTMMEDRRDLGSMSSALMMPTAMAQKMTVRANPEASAGGG